MPVPALFLDRDGVINYNRTDHVKSWDEFEFIPDALKAIRELSELGLPIVVVSNQAVIGRGLASTETVAQINRKMVEAVSDAGGRIDRVFYCPHHPDDGCECRKPRTGLLQRAAAELGIDLQASYLIGDSESDILAAEATGCRPILVRTGRGEEQLVLLRQHGIQGFFVADSLSGAAHWVLSQFRASDERLLCQNANGA